MILTRQTCGQRSSISVGSKRRALASYFPIRICYMFLMSKCRGESDVGLCTTSVFAKRMLLCCGNFWFQKCLAAKFVGICQRVVALCLQVPKMCTKLNPTQAPLHIDIRNIWQSCAQTWNASARRLLPTDMLERWPHVCSVKITFTLLLKKLFCFHNNEFNEMPCKLDSTENSHSFEKYPTPP